MNKAVHVLVYLILILAGVALYFEMNIFDKRKLLTDRNSIFEEYMMRIARTIEKVDAAKPQQMPEVRKDVSSVEAKVIDSPEMVNLLEDYKAQLEEANLETFNWDNVTDRTQLRQTYLVDAMGEVVLDQFNNNEPMKKGKGTLTDMLEGLLDRAKAQQGKLNTTRAELATIRAKLQPLADEINKLKLDDRQDKVEIEELKVKVTEADNARQAAEEAAKKKQGEIDDLDAEVTSLKDEVNTKNEELEAVKEDLAKAQKLADQLKKLLVQQQSQATSANSASSAVTSLGAGVKGTLVEVVPAEGFAIVEFSADAMDELLGKERDKAMPHLEFGVIRGGYKNPGCKYIGRIRLRQPVAGKNLVVADVLENWKQADVERGDEVLAE